MAQRNQNTRNRTPLVSFIVNSGEPVLSSSGSFSVPIEVRIFSNKQALVSSDVVFKFGVTKLGQVKTDITGTCNFVCQIPGSHSGETINIRIHLANKSDEILVMVPLPAKTNKKEKLEADQITLINWIISPTGLTSMNIRLVGDRGKVLKRTKVNLVFEGNNYQVKTDDLGHSHWELPRLIHENERITIFGTADSIKNECELKIWNAPVPTANVSLGGLVSRFSFIVLGILTLISFVTAFLSVGGILVESLVYSPVEKLANDSSIGAICIVVFLFSLIPPVLLTVNAIYYFVSTVLRRMKQRYDYDRSRMKKAKSGDPWLENFMDTIKEMREEKRSKKKKSDNSSVSGKNDSDKKSGFGGEIVKEVAAESIIRTGMALFKKFK